MAIPNWLCFTALSVPFLLSAWWLPVWLDCDESLNYGEPLHYLLHGHGMQPWEWSPDYALRSYTYLLPFWLWLYPWKLILGEGKKWILLRLARSAVALLSAACTTAMIRGVSDRLSPRIAFNLLLLWLITPASLLPNTFSAALSQLGWSYWLAGRDHPMLLLMALSCLIGWPYQMVFMLLPACISLNEKAVSLVRRWLAVGVLTVFQLALPMALVEGLFYGRLTLPALNTILYNTLNRAAGPTLYGTEPVSFYFANLFLNLNPILFVLSLLPPFIVPMGSRAKWIPMCSATLGLLIFTAQAHKEERFLFGLYPLLLLNAAIMMEWVWRGFPRARLLIPCVLVASVAWSVSRSLAMVHHWHAPEAILSGVKWPDKNVMLCYRSEWYRFPGHWFLPNHVRVGWLEPMEGGGGCMPQPFPASPSLCNPNLNNLNKPDPAQWTRLGACNFLVLSSTEEHPDDDHYQVIRCLPMLDAQSTRAPARWLWWGSRGNGKQWKEMCLWQRRL